MTTDPAADPATAASGASPGTASPAPPGRAARRGCLPRLTGLLAALFALAAPVYWLLTPLGWRFVMGFAPGEERHDVGSLDPEFRRCLDGLLSGLVAQGWRPVIRASWRDDRRQRLYHSLGGSQRASGSHHQHVRDGRPAARAADVSDQWFLPDHAHHAAFYLAMMKAAPAHGLKTGGAWKKTAPRWEAYGLGWDPAHVEVGDARRCGDGG